MSASLEKILVFRPLVLALERLPTILVGDLPVDGSPIDILRKRVLRMVPVKGNDVGFGRNLVGKASSKVGVVELSSFRKDHQVVLEESLRRLFKESNQNDLGLVMRFLGLRTLQFLVVDIVVALVKVLRRSLDKDDTTDERPIVCVRIRNDGSPHPVVRERAGMP